MNTKMLTFELTDDTEMLEIHGNREGLLHLAKILTSLAEERSPEHAHLMTEEWGGNSLSSEMQGLSNKLLNHVKIMVWPNTKSETDLPPRSRTS